MDLLLIFGSLVGLMLIGLPITFAMGLSALLFLLVSGQSDMLIMIPNRMVLALDSYGLMAIPFFYLAGALMSTGGLTQRLVNLCRALVGHGRGSLSMINVAASMVFGGVSGSCVADASAIGSVLIPAMKKDGYPATYSAALTGAAATVGHIIPPSIPMILIGVMQELPIGKLFLAGAIPGLLLGFSLMAVAYVIAVRRKYPKNAQRATFAEMARALLAGLPVLAMPVIVVGGIVFGVVTITETSVLACAYALLLGFVYREITLRNLWQTIRETSKSVANLLIILASAGFFSWVVLNTGLGDELVAGILAISRNKVAVITMLVIFLLFIGCLLDVIAMIFILVPVMFPLVAKVGLDPYHYSAVFVLTLGIALITPPVGILLYLVAQMAEAPLLGVIREMLPFIAVEIAVLALVTYVPVLSTWLPSLL